MNRDEIKTGLQELIRDILSLETVTISDASTAREFKGWDSLAHIDIILAAEEKFQVNISAIKASKLKTVGELIDLIYQQKN